jgi:hypothetical protein
VHLREASSGIYNDQAEGMKAFQMAFWPNALPV